MDKRPSGQWPTRAKAGVALGAYRLIPVERNCLAPDARRLYGASVSFRKWRCHMNRFILGLGLFLLTASAWATGAAGRQYLRIDDSDP